VAYGDLLRALQDEVRDQCRALEEEARREAARIAEEGRGLAAAAREEALALAASEGDSLREKARLRSALEEGRAVLVEQHRVLEEVREAARERLASRSTPGLTCSLLSEVIPDDDGSALVVTCDPGHAGACRDWLLRRHPEAAARATVIECPSPRGGVELAVGDGLIVDDTLPSRLARAWPGLGAELGRLLFGGDHD
jgi:vacuolar-type H+-ATPase subunit E/Vma4